MKKQIYLVTKWTPVYESVEAVAAFELKRQAEVHRDFLRAQEEKKKSIIDVVINVEPVPYTRARPSVAKKKPTR
jgi:acyl-homoserine lactone acylase PvdQ